MILFAAGNTTLIVENINSTNSFAEIVLEDVDITQASQPAFVSTIGRFSSLRGIILHQNVLYYCLMPSSRSKETFQLGFAKTYLGSIYYEVITVANKLMEKLFSSENVQCIRL